MLLHWGQRISIRGIEATRNSLLYKQLITALAALQQGFGLRCPAHQPRTWIVPTRVGEASRCGFPFVMFRSVALCAGICSGALAYKASDRAYHNTVHLKVLKLARSGSARRRHSE